MTKSEDFFFDSRCRTHVVATTVCATGCVHTHSVSHAHFLCSFSLRDVQTSRTRMAQGVCSAHVISLHRALSVLVFHPPSLLFPHGHFNTTFPSAPSSSSITRPKSAGQAHLRTSVGESGYLADPTHSTRRPVVEPEDRELPDPEELRRGAAKASADAAGARPTTMGGAGPASAEPRRRITVKRPARPEERREEYRDGGGDDPDREEPPTRRQ